MYVKTKIREYFEINKYQYTAEENFYNIVRAIFPKDKKIKRKTLKGTAKYNNGLKWELKNWWLKGVVNDERELIAVLIYGIGHNEDKVKRRVAIGEDEKIDITEVHLKIRDIQVWLKADEGVFKKEEKARERLRRLQKKAKMSPRDSKMLVDYEDVDSNKFELTFHFLTEWETSSIIKFYQGLITGDFDVYLAPVSERKHSPVEKGKQQVTKN